MPDITFDTMEAIPDGLKEAAKEVEGKFVVNVVPKAKLDEFRDNNLKISQERDGLKQKIDVLAPLIGDDFDGFKTEVERLKTVDQQVKDGKLKGSDNIEAEVARRVESMKQGYEQRLLAAEQARVAAEKNAGEFDNKYRRSVIDRVITDAVLDPKSGAEARALTDIVERASKVFKVKDDGSVVPLQGEAIIYGADGVSAMTPLEWLGKLKEEAPYFFKQSNGGGANGGGNNGGNGKTLPNGMTMEQFNKLAPEKRLALAHQYKLGAQ